VALSSNEKFWFDCTTCSHNFEAALYHVTGQRRQWCPYCSGNKICGNEGCTSCFARTFSAFNDAAKVAAWSARNDKNPHEVAMSSDYKAWFDCTTCEHEFEVRMADVTGKRQQWCPFCGNKRICGSAQCDSCVARSFASFENTAKVASWLARNDQKPHEVAMYSNKKFLFDCQTCGHEFDIVLNSVTGKQQQWCPFCANQRICGSAQCKLCVVRSFASFDDMAKIAAWSTRNEKGPHEVASFSNGMVWFNCGSCGREFKSRLSDVTGKRRCWCPHCATSQNKGMYALLTALEAHAPSAVVKTEDRIECQGRQLRIDARVTHGKNEFYVESDGPQHFSLEGMLQVQRKRGTTDVDELAAVEADFHDQLDRDRLKERTLRKARKLLFRFSYRQHGEMDRLVTDMLAKAALPRVGGETVYMDPEFYAPLINFNN